MGDRCYVFKVRVRLPSGRVVTEYHQVSEEWSQLGAAVAVGKVCRFYEALQQKRKIKSYRITV